MTSWRIRHLAIGVLLFAGAFAESVHGEDSAGATIVEEPITHSDRQHWSFQPIARPCLPTVNYAEWPQTAVDYFVLRRLEQSEIHPATQADRATLLRRLKFDLLGLPPTPDEVIRFANDDAPDAYERLVDQMLGSPAYGEHWAQFWLDLARFAETDGFEHDKVREDAWKYRQWVVDSLNDDLPYDRFIQLQLAGDLTGFSEDAIATTFCMAGPDMPDINEQDLRRHDKLNEITSTVGAAILGLQMHCCQCHDHKYDPISQADFFRLRGCFEAAVPVMKRDKAVNHLSAQPAAVTPWLYHRGELRSPGPQVPPRPPRIACSADSRVAFDGDHPREALVEWLFANENPLTARVIANRIWQHHFGRSLTENPSDFGIIASGPSHPQLLDWLATELRRNDWSIKHLHRLILLSATYRQASSSGTSDHDDENWNRATIADPGNKLYSRFPRKRLEGEAIRDALLAISGQLNCRYGGPSVRPPLPRELTTTLLTGQWNANEHPADHTRRSIYVFARRNLRYPIFEVFDRPDAGATCARRDRSTTAIQALQMLNSDLVFDAARHLRDRLISEEVPSKQTTTIDIHPHSQVIERLFLHVLSRHPTEVELERFSEVLSTGESFGDDLLAACVGLFNASEFVYVD